MVFAICVMSAEALIRGNGFRSYTRKQYLMIALGTFVDSIACIAITLANQLAESAFISILGYVVIFYAFLADVFIFHEKLQIRVVICSLIIVLTCLYITYQKMKIKE